MLWASLRIKCSENSSKKLTASVILVCCSNIIRYFSSPPLPNFIPSGEKPFECDECDQSFRQKQLLKRHKNLYHTPDYLPRPPREKTHECGECDKAFAHKGNLIRHLATHDPELQGKCGGCFEVCPTELRTEERTYKPTVNLASFWAATLKGDVVL